jgi:hypothetical protein
VALGSTFGDHQLCRDLPVGQPVGHERGDFPHLLVNSGFAFARRMTVDAIGGAPGLSVAVVIECLACET